MRHARLLLLAAFITGTSNFLFSQSGPNLENGWKPFGSYDGSHLDTVNLMNGNLMFHGPILPDVPQRGSTKVVYTLFATSKDWQDVCFFNTYTQRWQCNWQKGGGFTDIRMTPSLSVHRTLNKQYTGGQGTTTFAAYGYTITSTDGSVHQLHGVAGTEDVNLEPTQFDSVDLSGYHLVLSVPDSNYATVLDHATVTDRAGTRYEGDFGAATGCGRITFSGLSAPGNYRPIFDDSPAGDQYCSQLAFASSLVTDSNGNQVYVHGPLSPNPTTDTLGKNPPLTSGLVTTDPSGCVSSHPFISAVVYNYQDPNGVTQQIKVCTAEVPIQTAFNQPHPYYPSLMVGEAVTSTTSSGLHFMPISTVLLADGTHWTFDYDGYGEIISIGLPTGGSITYTWATIQFNSCDLSNNTQFSRAVATRTLNDGQGHTYQWRYTWGTPANGLLTNIVTDPLGHDTVHTFSDLSPLAGLVAACNFYETATIQYQGAQSANQPLQRVDTSYTAANVSYDAGTVTNSSAPGNVFATDVVTTVYPSGKVKKVHKDPDAGLGAGLPIFGNTVKQLEYDWGQGQPGALLRETDTVYQWQKSSSYLAAHLLDLPASSVIISPNAAANVKSGCPLNASGGTANCMAETDFSYDEAPYLTSASINTQHVSPPNGVRGNQTTVSKWLNTSNSLLSSHTNWYDTGEVYQSIDPLGHTTTHSYDPAYIGAYATQTCSPTTSSGSVAHCVSGTYDFNTGVLTSLTNENATAQASGNTPGDSAHTSNYTYDYMFRITSAQTPPDPANSGLRAQTSFSFSAPNSFPITATRLKSITPALSDSATSFFDGLGRSFKTQHAVPGNTATVDTTFDLAGHPATVSNPYFSTSDATYGLTQNAYDGLDRVTTVTKQDGSISSVAYSVITGVHDAVANANTVGDCTDSTDEAGKQRRACVDGLGRLVMVAEPNPGAAATTATGVVTINGNEQTTGGAATSGSTTITISGSERTGQLCLNTCHTIWDVGTVTITVAGYPGKSVNYGKFDTAATIGWNLSCAFHNDASSPVDAPCPASAGASTTVNLTARATGFATNYSFTTASATTDNTGVFTDPSFFAGPASGAFTGGNNAGVSDSGNIAVTVNGTNYTVTFGAGDTGAAIATRLASAMSGNTAVSALASANQVNLTSRTVGSAGNATLSASYTWNGSVFTQPSFTTSASGVFGGYDVLLLDNNPYKTLYTYDPLGNLLRVDQKGSAPADSTQWRTRIFTYDSLSRLLTANNPESGTISYAYDNDGELLQKTSPAPNQIGTLTQTVSYCYDELHRVTGRGYGAQSCPLSSPVVSYTYDSGANAKGHLTSMTDQAGTANYSYDILGRLTTETRSLTGANGTPVSKTVSYDYNLDGSLKTLHYPSGAVVTYTPDSAGRMLSAIDSGNSINYVTGATYGPDSALTGFVSGNSGNFAGITNTFSYNRRLQPLTMSATAPSQTVFSIGYDFHAGNGTAGSGTDNGNVFGIFNYKDTTHGRDQSFTYDPLNRLISAQNAGTNCATMVLQNKTEYWGNSYGYDAWGNLLNKTVTKCGAENLSVTADNHNWIHTTAPDYQYDAAGNMTHDATSGLNYTFDQENRITGASGYTYTYDGDGNRVRKSNGTLAANGTLYWYMTPGVVAESDLAGSLKSEYVFFDGERVARKDFPGNTVAYYFSDHLKTASVITDSVGTIKAESDYYPWGGELQFVSNDSNHYKFTGKEWDAESGLDYFGARYYSNGLGRWITPDWAAKATAVPYAEFADPQTLNLYAYVRNLPTTRYDADGHENLKPQDWGVHNDPTVTNFDRQMSGVILAGFAVACPACGRVIGGLAAVHAVRTGDKKGAVLNAAAAVVPGGKLLGGLSKAAKAETLAANAARGKAFQNAVQEAKATVQTGTVQNVMVETQSGTRTVVDVMGRDGTGNIALTEAKSSATAPLTPNQAAAHPEIAESGATVVGQGKGEFTGGTQVPPTKVDVVRPADLKEPH